MHKKHRILAAAVMLAVSVTLGFSDDGQSAVEIMEHVYEERRRELFIEGHRLNDMLRLGIPFPSGADPFNDRRYGDTTCFPLPDVEKENNENIPS